MLNEHTQSVNRQTKKMYSSWQGAESGKKAKKTNVFYERSQIIELNNCSSAHINLFIHNSYLIQISEQCVITTHKLITCQQYISAVTLVEIYQPNYVNRAMRKNISDVFLYHFSASVFLYIPLYASKLLKFIAKM